MKDGGAAFPGKVLWSNETGEYIPVAGMTRRQWLAGLAVQAHIIGDRHDCFDTDDYVQFAYEIADAMIAHEEEECKTHS